jgi:hypothetical protein
LLPAPTAPSEGSAGVRSTLDPAPENRCVTPLLDPGSPAQASLSTEPLPLSRSPIDLLDCAARRFAGRSTVPACLFRTEVPQSLSHSMFRGPSWTDHSSRPALPSAPKCYGPRRARGRSALPAPLPGWPGKNPKALPIPAGGDRTLGHLPLPVPVSGFSKRPGPPSRSPAHNAPLFRVAKANFSPSVLWITGISGKIGGTFRDSPEFAASAAFIRAGSLRRCEAS